jgi:hypothetical protein
MVFCKVVPVSDVLEDGAELDTSWVEARGTLWKGLTAWERILDSILALGV